MFKTLHEFGQDEIIINKSRFIGYAKPIETEQEAIEFISGIKAKHKDATHNVYAYMVGESSNIQRYSDDGEPSGTAGIPILDILKKEDLRNVVVVVTRYFGGIKLGVGGLVRAYIKGAKAGLDSARIVDKVLYNLIKVRIDYTLHGKIENELMKHKYAIKNIEFDDCVNMSILCEDDDAENLIGLIREITSDRFEYEVMDKMYVSVLDGKVLD